MLGDAKKAPPHVGNPLDVLPHSPAGGALGVAPRLEAHGVTLNRAVFNQIALVFHGNATLDWTRRTVKEMD